MRLYLYTRCVRVRWISYSPNYLSAIKISIQQAFAILATTSPFPSSCWRSTFSLISLMPAAITPKLLLDFYTLSHIPSHIYTQPHTLLYDRYAQLLFGCFYLWKFSEVLFLFSFSFLFLLFICTHLGREDIVAS